MKNLWKLLCAMAILLTFAACTEKDEESDVPADADLVASINGTWQVDRMTLNGASVEPSQYDFDATITFDKSGVGILKISHGTRTFDYTIHGTTVQIQLPDVAMSLHIDKITDSEMSASTDNIPWMGIEAPVTLHLIRVAHNGGNNNGGDNNGGNNNGDYGVEMPYDVEITATTIAVASKLLPNESVLELFPNATCGFIWCLQTEGAPTFGSDNYIDCTQAARGNEGHFKGKITGLTPATWYNIAPYLRLTPDGDPIIGDHRSFQTTGQNNSGNSSDTNWVKVNHVRQHGANTVEVSFDSYFDSGMPIAIGVCYNTTGNPTIADFTYNGLEHVNPETFEHDDTVVDFFPLSNGARTIKLLVGSLQVDTTYYFRVYVQWESSDIHPIIYSDVYSITITERK